LAFYDFKYGNATLNAIEKRLLLTKAAENLNLMHSVITCFCLPQRESMYEHLINCQAQSLGFTPGERQSFTRALAYLRSLDFVRKTVLGT
jgi:hypothetical protein